MMIGITDTLTNLASYDYEEDGDDDDNDNTELCNLSMVYDQHWVMFTISKMV
jgi:hypothetical protein